MLIIDDLTLTPVMVWSLASIGALLLIKGHDECLVLSHTCKVCTVLGFAIPPALMTCRNYQSQPCIQGAQNLHRCSLT